MTLNTDDIKARLCWHCDRFLEHDENCGIVRQSDNKWFQHTIEEGTLTELLNKLIEKLESKINDN